MMEREIKFKFHFDNHAPVDLTLNELMGGGAFLELWRNNAGHVTAKRQYIDRKDKNGKEIYEGDVIKAFIDQASSPNYLGTNIRTKEYIGVIVWHCGTFEFINKSPKRPKTYNPLSIGIASGRFWHTDDGRIENVECIGNIHDNPELLTQN